MQAQDLESQILGKWTLEKYDSESFSRTYKSSRRLKKKETGFEFRKDGVALVRTNSMGCSIITRYGRSISFLDNVEGKWKLNEENKIEISFETFMGINNVLGELRKGKLITKQAVYKAPSGSQ